MGHVISECRKKIWADSNKANQNSLKSSKPYNNSSNFKYNPGVSSSEKSNLRCSFCSKKGHEVASCRFRQKLIGDNNISNNTSNSNNTVSCKYCKKTGHTIDFCRKRIYNNSQKSNNAQSSTSSNSNGPRRCYRCNELTHIAKYCPLNTNSNQNF